MVSRTLKKSCSLHRESSDWAGLPTNVVDGILVKLVSLGDYVRFGAVCLPWRRVALDDHNYRGNQRSGIDNSTRFTDHQLPLLMLPHWLDDKNTALFYSEEKKKELEFELPVGASKRFIGSSLGWLISVETDFSLTLFNPFSAPNSIIRLPSVVDENGLFNPEYYLVKAVLSADPILHPDEYAVMVIYGVIYRLAYIRPGVSKKWFYIQPSLCGVADVIYSNRNRLFYALHVDGDVCSINAKEKEEEFMVKYFAHDLKTERPFESRYLVESGGGDLLQVMRWCPTNYTTDLKVFKLDKGTTFGCWVELNNIGEEVLFLGDNSSISVWASDFPGCQPGSINFLLPVNWDFLFKGRPVPPIWPPYDMGVANISIQQPQSRCHLHNIQYQNYNGNPRFVPIWVIPTYQGEGVIRSRP